MKTGDPIVFVVDDDPSVREALADNLFGHSRKLDSRFSFHFVHDQPAMNFDGDFAAA